MKKTKVRDIGFRIPAVAIAALLISPGCARRLDNLAELGKYDVVWDEPGHGSKDSMPAGNGDISLNVWTEKETGSVCFYIGKSDAWDETGRLLKIGKVRVRIEPNPFAGGSFSQRLHLRAGAVEVTAGEGPAAARLLIWADANRPVVRVEARAPSTSTVTAAIEPWRLEPAVMKDALVSGLNYYPEIFGPTVVQPDVVVVVFGPWDTLELKVGGRLLEVGTSGWRAYALNELSHAVDVLSSDGAEVMLLTAPCFKPRDLEIDAAAKVRLDPQRVKDLNDLYWEFARQHADRVVIADLNHLACPEGEYTDVTIDGVDLREDGVHFTPDGADVVARWLMPEIIAAVPEGHTSALGVSASEDIGSGG